ncbi:biotin--[acetyl-CoA-carboxylase] ligase [Stieleria sp. JC731]|uniref:biotin--[acetyl-CoA-carboxylase] ligase n=1 Tax=Pirellulaceae TaxID=2691357 RepID=UPI001E46FB58|nr:biotin--[acetyl-CoA-carboxylase] ligase [Stieleria sp. JC731]MCC9599309.1 biotin--[acetyl-CoA-carboxylase] ligase [Stieleria sp. JC731]
MRLAVTELLSDGVIGSCRYADETLSTNTDALNDVQSGLANESHLPKLFLTDRQTSGRGRQGNQWLSSHDSLTFSLLIRFDVRSPNATLISIAAGIGVAQGIEHSCAPLKVSLKWPNDICIVETTPTTPQLRKLGGILIETSASAPDRMVIGIGINIDRAPELTDTETSAVALTQIAQRSICREDLLQSIVTSVLELIDETTGDDAASSRNRLIQSYRSRCALSGRQISLRQNDQIIEGHCLGISDDGSLRLQHNGQHVDLRSGEVQQVRFR